MRRLISFGCSFASQIYPTWNEILGLFYDRHLNYGKGGAGNRYIFTALMNLLADGIIGKDDTVVIQWSSTHRFDLYREGMWHCYGNVMNRPDIPKQFADQYFDPVSATIETCTYAAAACRILDQLGCEWYMACFHEIAQPMEDERWPITCKEPVIARLARDISAWESRWASMPIFEYCISSGLKYKTWEFHDGHVDIDLHPTPIMAYSWLRDCLLPRMGLDHNIVRDQAVAWQGMHDTVTRVRDLPSVYRDTKKRWDGPDVRPRYLDRDFN